MMNDFNITSGGSINENLDGDLTPTEPWTWKNAGSKIIDDTLKSLVK